MSGNSKGEELIDKSNIRFYNAFESLSIEGMEEVWKHSDDVVCVHPGWDLFTGWMAIRESWVTIFQNTDKIQFHITNTKLRTFENIAIVICLENIRTNVYEGKIRMGVVATNIFERQNSNSEEKWLMVHHHGSLVSNYVPPNPSL
jgi:ketosteroid isomerase-like protein